MSEGDPISSNKETLPYAELTLAEALEMGSGALRLEEEVLQSHMPDLRDPVIVLFAPQVRGLDRTLFFIGKGPSPVMYKITWKPLATPANTFSEERDPHVIADAVLSLTAESAAHLGRHYQTPEAEQKRSERTLASGDNPERRKFLTNEKSTARNLQALLHWAMSLNGKEVDNLTNEFGANAVALIGRTNF